MHLAFYAPLKPPDDPVPSGDREMARLLIRALRLAGHTVEIASTLRGHFRQPDGAALAAFEDRARAEARLLLARWRGSDAPRPQLWFTYHPYYKALDLVGPLVAAELDIA